MAYKLLSTQDVKDLSKGDLGSDHDTLLSSVIIPAVGEILASYCNRPDWDKAARTEYFSPIHYQRFLSLSSPPIASSPAIQLWVDTAIPRAYGGDTLLVEGTNYFLHEEEGSVESGWSYWGGSSCGLFPPGPKSVKVTYTGGYLTADGTGAPTKLKLAAMMQTKILFDRREEYGLSSRSLDGGSLSITPYVTLPKAVTLLIDDLRRILV